MTLNKSSVESFLSSLFPKWDAIRSVRGSLGRQGVNNPNPSRMLENWKAQTSQVLRVLSSLPVLSTPGKKPSLLHSFPCWHKDGEYPSSPPHWNPKWVEENSEETSHFCKAFMRMISAGLFVSFSRHICLWDDFGKKHKWNIKCKTQLFILLPLSYEKLLSHFISCLLRNSP